ncbi:MAG: hypothetical protein HYU58_09395 [Proteobacteria bacterium]|nr:hypothetical protein [Pseudomonadota bacterium]
MSDDLDDLRARVAAARDRLASDVDFAQKVELRLNDLARIVEGSLARQSAELDGAKARIAHLEDDLGRALARAEQAIGEASRAERLAKENGELKTMVMALLEVIEGRQKSSLTSVMQKLEENVSALVTTPEPVVDTAPPDLEPAPAEAAPESEPEQEIAAELQPVEGPASDDIELELEPMTDMDEAPSEPSQPATEPAALEDLSEIALYDAADEVVEPGRK